MITTPNEVQTKYMCSLHLQCSNNQVEYQALILGLRVSLSMEAKFIKIFRDSQLMIKQLIWEYKCNDPALIELLDLARTLQQQFVEVTISHIPRSDNEVVNELAQQASRFWLGLNEVNNLDIVETQPRENKD